MSEIFFNSSRQIFSISLLVIISIGIFYLFGEILLKLLKTQIIISVFDKITAGMSLIIFIGWYSYSLGVQIKFYILFIYIISILIVLYQLIIYLKKLHSSSNSINEKNQILSLEYYVIIGLVLFFTIQSIIAFKFSLQPIGRISNNDIFNWSLIADHFLGKTNLNNIPGGGDAFNAMRIDAWGTYFVLATISSIGTLSALEATTPFSVLSLTIITLGIFELTKKIFSLSTIPSFFIAILTGGGSFFFILPIMDFMANYWELFSSLPYLSRYIVSVVRIDRRY